MDEILLLNVKLCSTNNVKICTFSVCLLVKHSNDRLLLKVEVATNLHMRVKRIFVVNHDCTFIIFFSVFESECTCIVKRIWDPKGNSLLSSSPNLFHLSYALNPLAAS